MKINSLFQFSQNEKDVPKVFNNKMLKTWVFFYFEKKTLKMLFLFRKLETTEQAPVCKNGHEEPFDRVPSVPWPWCNSSLRHHCLVVSHEEQKATKKMDATFWKLARTTNKFSNARRRISNACYSTTYWWVAVSMWQETKQMCDASCFWFTFIFEIFVHCSCNDFFHRFFKQFSAWENV